MTDVALEARAIWGLPSGWNIYWILLFSATLALLVPLAARALTRLFHNRLLEQRKRQPGAASSGIATGNGAPSFILTNEKLASAIESQKAKEAETIIGRKILIRSLNSVVLSLFFFVLVIVLVPMIGLMQPEAGATIIFRAYFLILSVSVLALVAIVYATRKGNTWWVNSRAVDQKGGKQ